MGDTLIRRAARTALWTVLCALLAAVPLGISLLSLRFVLDEQRGGHHTLVLLFVVAAQLLAFGAPMPLLFYVNHRWADRIRKRNAVVCWAGIVVVCLGWFGALLSARGDVDQQILHDRGVTQAGVVTKYEKVQGDGASTLDVVATVRLADGTTTTVSDYDPKLGSAVRVTVDPLHKADPQFGRRPGAPDRLDLKVCVAILTAGYLLAASGIAGPLAETLTSRGPRHRGTPTDETPADKLTSGSASLRRAT
ncbi:hypothetical protein RKE30_20680 [Streptomyces sp. Li-HN-5-11]|uniref:hypothetical protein n=1 Tax=Streptomyces sp. Li-HN-5-11 TaxID=3075432 RepID=UPI0028AB2BF7|nr:hypothetical protein [Streptomyces sp. Li-HN-5-11]WNM32649.1 hypothetical protein RKE30_20680 [Streptomyces sp. Li-HN-5-11]